MNHPARQPRGVRSRHLVQRDLCRQLRRGSAALRVQGQQPTASRLRSADYAAIVTWLGLLIVSGPGCRTGWQLPGDSDAVVGVPVCTRVAARIGVVAYQPHHQSLRHGPLITRRREVNEGSVFSPDELSTGHARPQPAVLTAHAPSNSTQAGTRRPSQRSVSSARRLARCPWCLTQDGRRDESHDWLYMCTSQPDWGPALAGGVPARQCANTCSAMRCSGVGAKVRVGARAAFARRRPTRCW